MVPDGILNVTVNAEPPFRLVVEEALYVILRHSLHGSHAKSPDIQYSSILLHRHRHCRCVPRCTRTTWSY